MATSQTKITELQGRVSQLENDVAAKEIARQQLADQVSELQTQIETLKREKNEKDEEIKNLKEQLKSQGDAELRAELALKEKEILKAIYDKNDPRYKTLNFVSEKERKNGNEGEDLIKLTKQGEKYVYTALTGVKDKNFEFTDDDFRSGANGKKTETKVKTLQLKQQECIAGKGGQPCDESKIPELNVALEKYQATTNFGDLNNLTDTEKDYICRMDKGICTKDHTGKRVLDKTYSQITDENKKVLGWFKTILNEGKRELDITYNFSVDGTMTKGGNSVKLSYSDFGMFESKVDIHSVDNTANDPVVKAEINEILKKQAHGSIETSYFAQGIDELKANVRPGSNDMTFKGKTFATLEKHHCNGNCSESLNGDVKLSVTGATAMGKLELDFGSSLNLQASNLDLTKNTFNDWEFYNNVTATGSKIDGYTKSDPNGTKLNLNMYGPEADKPTEAVGIYKFGFQRNCHGGPECEELRLKGAFGAKKE